MKAFVATVMLIALYLLYRIACPPKAQSKKNGENSGKPEITEENTENAVGKSRYVRAFVHPDNGQPAPTPATSPETVARDEKANIFAAGNGNSDAVIPPEKLNEIFGNPPEPETENAENAEVDENDLDIPPDEDGEDGTGTGMDVDADEEAEDLRRTLGRDAELADGFSIEEMSAAVAGTDKPDVEKEQAAVLYELSKTDMFEQLVSGDAGRASRIKAVLDRYEKDLAAEENDGGDRDYGNFNIADFLS